MKNSEIWKNSKNRCDGMDYCIALSKAWVNANRDEHTKAFDEIFNQIMNEKGQITMNEKNINDRLSLLRMSQNKRYCKKNRELFKRIAKKLLNPVLVPSILSVDGNEQPTKTTTNCKECKYIDAKGYKR